MTPRPAIPTLCLRCFAALLVLWLAQGAAAVPPATSEREVEVLSALINHGRSIDTRLLVIADETTGDPAAIAADTETIAAIVRDFEIPPAMFADWARRNARSSALDRPLLLDVSYQMLDRKTLAELFDGVEPKRGWQQFFARFGGAPGLLRVSRVGFDDSALNALVYLEHQCGAECGAGRLFHLARENSAWVIKRAALVWMTE